MLFIRIVENGYNKNGNVKYKIYIYEQLSYKPEQYDYMSDEKMKGLNWGRYYSNGRYIMTILQKWQILGKLNALFGNEYNYIFE
jgi:hypothetical protein